MKRLTDRFGRNIDYLRVSVTDRCNLRCLYCIPKEGVKLVPGHEILNYEEILRIIKVFSELGIKKIRITGGEPLVRKDVIKLVENIKNLNVIEDLSMTTNGILLCDYARDLKKAGLNRINISLDTLDPERFCDLTGFSQLDNVLLGIRQAVKEELTPVKVNAILLDKKSKSEINEFVRLTVEDPIHVRFLEFMPVAHRNEQFFFTEDILEEICPGMEQVFVCGNGPAKYYKLKGAVGTVGFIRPITKKFCSSCNRLRLTSRGMIKSCLHSDVGINLKEPLRRGCSDKTLAELIRTAVQLKPKEHNLSEVPLGTLENSMCQIGG